MATMFTCLPNDIHFDLMLKLDLNTLSKFSQCSSKLNTISHNRLLWTTLLQTDFLVTSSDEPKHIYMELYEIVQFFSQMYSIITIPAILLIHKHIPLTWWDQILKVQSRNSELHFDWYQNELGWVDIRILIYDYILGKENVEMDFVYNLILAVKASAHEIYKSQTKVGQNIYQNPELTRDQKEELIQNMILTPTQIYIHQQKVIIPFDPDLLEIFVRQNDVLKLIPEDFEIKTETKLTYIGLNHFLQNPQIDPSERHNKAIIDASSNGLLDIVNQLLQDSRVDPSAKLNSAVKSAINNEHFDVARRLLQHQSVRNTLPSDELQLFTSKVEC